LRRELSGQERAVGPRPTSVGTNYEAGEYRVKRTVLGILALATLAFAPPASGEDIGGWQEARWGMTPSEVQKVLSYPTSVADLAKVCAEKCDEGAALELDDYQLDDQHFLVRFWFTKPDTHLRTVSMYAKQLDDANGKEAFTKIKNFLETSYGTPRSTVLKHGDFVISWNLPSTTITLYSNATNFVTIVYEVRSDKKNGKS
jgi:hypothetical protein